MNLFVTGIGTNVGKTVVSAILTEALFADYWKPIQSGTIEGKDSEIIKSLINNSKSVFPQTPTQIGQCFYRRIAGQRAGCVCR